MRHVVWKAYYDFEKEEKYINEMSAKGWALVGYSWCRYVFEDAPRGEYLYRIELLEKQVDHPESQDYIRFMEDTGTELVASYNRWVYFRRKAALGEFNIYSDIDSRIKHYKNVRVFFEIAVMLNFFAGILNLCYGDMAASIGAIPVNSYIAVISMAVAALLIIFQIAPLSKKIGTLQKEREIRE